MDSGYFILGLIPVGGGLIAVLVSVMSRLSRIETDVKWIKKMINDTIFFDLDTKP